MTQRTLGLIKPNATKENLQYSILSDVDNSKYDLKVVETKTLTLTRELAASFYAEHENKVWFESLIDFMTSGDIVAFVMEGDNAVLDYRSLMGATDPAEATEGTLRSKYATLKEENSVHGSDSLESAKREILHFFA